MKKCDSVSEYYKMCVAAGLNYYRLVPDIDDLLKLFGLGTRDFIYLYDCYTQNNEIPRYPTDKHIVIKMLMKEKHGLDWDGTQWFDERENLTQLCDFLGDD